MDDTEVNMSYSLGRGLWMSEQPKDGRRLLSFLFALVNFNGNNWFPNAHFNLSMKISHKVVAAVRY